MTRTVAFNESLSGAWRLLGGTMDHGESLGGAWRGPAEDAFAGMEYTGEPERSQAKGSGRWKLDHLRRHRVSTALLEEQAQRLETAAAKDEAIALREVLLIVTPWGIAGDPAGWAVKSDRIEALIAMQALLTAMTEMLPCGATFSADVSENGRPAAQVILSPRLRGQCRRASTAALALGAAMFRALAAHAAQT